MGEAKRKSENARLGLIEELDKWLFPATDWERLAVKEILATPSAHVTRLPADQLARMNMKAQQCHVNASEYARLDPEKKTEHLIGWWVQPERLVLHSVVRREGTLICLTPTSFGHGSSLKFIHDGKIEVREDGNRRPLLRDGVNIGPGLRIEPEALIAKYSSWKARLEAGEDPNAVLIDW